MNADRRIQFTGVAILVGNAAAAPEAVLRSGWEFLEAVRAGVPPWKGEALRAVALKRQDRVGVSIGMRR